MPRYKSRDHCSALRGVWTTNRAIVPLLLTAIGLGGCRLGEFPYREQYALFRSIRRGMTEKEVRVVLGEPVRVYSKGVSPDEYCVPGWACERREILHRLLIYQRGEPIAYVFIDSSDRVEYVYVGGS